MAKKNSRKPIAKAKRKSIKLTEVEAAYKEYIIENFPRTPPANWAKYTAQADYKALDSTEKSLDDFIEEYIKNNPKYDQEKITGKTILTTLKRNLKQKTTELKLNPIATIFDITPNFATFTSDKPRVDKYAKNFHKRFTEKEEIRLSQTPLIYLCYYSKVNEIDFAILEISKYDNRSWKEGKIIFYHRKNKEGSSSIEFFPGSHQNFKNEVLNSNVLFLHCKGRLFEGDATIVVKNSKINLHTFLTIDVGGTVNIHERKILLGTFSSIGRQNSLPSCGVMLFQLVRNGDEAIEIINKDSIDSRIFYFLHEKNLNTRYSWVLQSLDDLHLNSIIDKIKPCVGIYFGRHLDSKYNDIPNTEAGAFRTILLQIFENAQAKIWYVIGEDQRELSGFFYLRHEHLLYGTFKNIELSSDELSESSRLSFVLETPLKKHGTYLNGVYSGFRENSDKPKSGLVSFKKVPNAKTIAEVFKDPAYQIGNYQKEDQLKNASIYSQLLKPNFIKFFRGDFGNYYDSLRKSVHPKIYEELNIVYENTQVKYNGPIGTFYLYSFSSQKYSIVRYPLLIESSGKLRLKILNRDNIPDTVDGQAKYYGSYLVLDFHLNKFSESRGFFLLYVHSGNFTRLKIAAGVSMRPNYKGKPQAKREFLIPVYLPDLKQLKNPNSIEWDEVDKNIVNEFDNLSFKDIYYNSPEFTELTQITITQANHKASLVETLFGREYNVITTPTTTNEEKLLKREEFWKIYLISACLAFYPERDVIREMSDKYFENDSLMYKKLKEKSETYRYFNLSLEHGFIALPTEKALREVNLIASKIKNAEGINEVFEKWFQFHKVSYSSPNL